MQVYEIVHEVNGCELGRETFTFGDKEDASYCMAIELAAYVKRVGYLHHGDTFNVREVV